MTPIEPPLTNDVRRPASNPRRLAGQTDGLSRLDHAVLDRTYGTTWLVVASVAGGVVACVGLVGMFAGGGGGATAEPFAIGTAVLALALFEIWRRRRAAEGQPPPLWWLRRLDDRVLKRRAVLDAQRAAVHVLDNLREALVAAGQDAWARELSPTASTRTVEDLVDSATQVIKELLGSDDVNHGAIRQLAEETLAVLVYATECRNNIR
ncbi:MAG TPA: hypothetical protein VHC43_08660 [Mycobacteriales bacterium]|nr:hypothetical protein [Mycobacteriales bacterium]